MFMNWAKAGSDECEVEKSESLSWTECGNQRCRLLFLGSGHPVYYQRTGTMSTWQEIDCIS